MRRWVLLILLLDLAGGPRWAFADSGNEAYCVCKGAASVADCKACCKQDCHDTNWGGDLFGLCTNRCQKNCDLYNTPNFTNPLNADVAAACATVAATQVTIPK